jgi:hypothetical protein
VACAASNSSNSAADDADSSRPKRPRQQQPRSSDNEAGNKRPSRPAGSQPQQNNSSGTKRPRSGSSSSNDSTAARGRQGDAVGDRKQVGGANKQQRSSARSSQQISPQVLTSLLKAAATPEQLLQLVQRHAGDLNHIHLAAAFTRAKALRTEGVPPQQLSELLSQLRQLAQRMQQQCGATELANIIWSCSTLSSRDTAAELLPVFLQSDKLQDAKPQEVSNVLWAAATLPLQLTDEQLQQLLDRFQQLLSRLNSQDVSNTLLACAKLQFAPLQLLSALEQQPQQLQGFLEGAIPQHLANTAWACGQLGYSSKQLPGALLQQAQAAAEQRGCSWLCISKPVQPVLVSSSAGQSAVCAAGAAACRCRKSGVGKRGR